MFCFGSSVSVVLKGAWGGGGRGAKSFPPPLFALSLSPGPTRAQECTEGNVPTRLTLTADSITEFVGPRRFGRLQLRTEGPAFFFPPYLSFFWTTSPSLPCAPCGFSGEVRPATNEPLLRQTLEIFEMFFQLRCARLLLVPVRPFGDFGRG